MSIYGGARALPGVTSRPPFGVRSQARSAQKRTIAESAPKLRRAAPVPICAYDRIDAFVADDAITGTERAAMAGETTLLVAPA
jgi:DeoR/GlpR family transcriptional regulator of sugar metabolism